MMPFSSRAASLAHRNASRPPAAASLLGGIAALPCCTAAASLLAITALTLVACGRPYDVSGREGNGSPTPRRADAGTTPDRLPIADGGPAADTGPPVSDPRCEALGRASCEQTSGCVPRICSGCDGQPPGYVGCAPDDGRELCGGDCPIDVDCPALDQTSCEAEPACQADYCYACNALAPVWNGCRFPDQPAPACPDFPGCPACRDLDEASCQATPGCAADHCRNCSSGDPVFSGCRVQADPPAGCLDPDLCQSCQDLDETSCGQAPGCHPVFESALCANAANCETPPCCSFFSRCAEGGQAVCQIIDSFCDATPPYCEAPLVVSFTGDCYEGCVYPDECG